MKPLIAFLIVMAFIFGSPLNMLSQNAVQQYQKGLMKEEGEGNLQEAIEIYSQIAQDRNADLSIRATSAPIDSELIGHRSSSKSSHVLFFDPSPDCSLP